MQPQELVVVKSVMKNVKTVKNVKRNVKTKSS